MESMFDGCESLISLNLSSFDTSKTKNMEFMFNNCKILERIDVSNFDTSLVTSMKNMFSGCEKLLFLDIKNFNFSFTINFDNMFDNCISLIYLNIDELEINQENRNYQNIFGVKANDTEYCIRGFDKDILLNYNIISNCSHTCFKNDSSIIFEKRICIEKCEKDEEYRYEYNKRCYKICPNGTHPSYRDEYLCEEDKKCPELNINISKCQEKAEYGYYFDINDEIYKACYKNCEKCYGPGNEDNNNCSKCIKDMSLLDENYKKTNCFPKCNYYYYLDIFQNYFCTNNSECPKSFPKLVKEKNKCINNCTNDNKYKFEYNNTCYIESQKDTIYTNDININNNISKDEYEDDDLRRKEKKILNFQKDLMGGTFDDIINNVTKNKEDYVQDEGDLILQITTSENQKNNNNKN
jgi:surface protein